LSIAIRATSAGVENKGPTSTSNPRSANPLAITLAPLSCPSYPILATKILGLLPNFTEKFLTFYKASSYSFLP
jgi:hypothetical protein